MGAPTEKEFRNLHALIGVEDGIAKAIWAFEEHKEQLLETEQGSRIKYVNELLQTLRLLSAENTNDYWRSVERKRSADKQEAEND